MGRKTEDVFYGAMVDKSWFSAWFLMKKCYQGIDIVKVNLMGGETGKQNWHALLFFLWPRFVYRVLYFSLSYVRFMCKYAGVSFELGEHWREKLPQSYLNSADTQQQHTAPTHPVWYPPGNMGLAFVDSSFLG